MTSYISCNREKKYFFSILSIVFLIYNVLLTMMEKDKNLRVYWSFFYLVKKLLNIMGIFPINNTSIFYNLKPYFAMFVAIFLTISIVRFVIDHITNVAVMTKGLSLTLSYITVTLKLVMLKFYKNDMIKLHESLEKNFNNYINNTKIKYIILKKINNLYRLSKILTIGVGGSSLAYLIVPIIFYVIQLLKHKEKIFYVSPAPAKFPWSNDHYHVLPWIYDMISFTIGSITLTATTCGTDASFPFYLFQMSANLRVMSDKLNNINSDDNYYEAIRECALKYESLIKCRGIIEKVYGPIIIWTIISNAVILCSLIFQMSKMESIGLGSLIVATLYASSKALQTFIYASAGTFLTSESENFIDAIYACNWTLSSKQKFRTSILILLSQKPMIITACSLTVVSVDMFVAVLNTSISYFFLLKTMETKMEGNSSKDIIPQNNATLFQ
uniref:Odorant receptor n=1 Tax=Aphidius gifuensis TaxID=684658 RepID=A0A3Q9EL49_APHGI|nr:odorant receptor [Aphidius gifuensis]